jgi:hypothetical protein
MDYFYAILEGNSLMMEPFCGQCKEQLNEYYYCENCKRQCLCTHIVCANEETFEFAKRFVQNTPTFHKFKVSIGPRR